MAIIDSGIDASHPAVGPVQGFVAIREQDGAIHYDSGPHSDVQGHGTAIAGIIRALAPECELYSIRVLDHRLNSSASIFLAGLNWAIEHNMHVCNLSLGTVKKDFFAPLHELADRAYFNNMMLIAAANNQPVPSFPSVYSSVISVRAHSEPDPYGFYYHPRSPIAFSAYGTNVRVPWLEHSWALRSGNSFAAPHITGIAARILGKHPDMAPFQMKALLCALAKTPAAPADPRAGAPAAGYAALA